jgi:hypothetical protein
MHASTRMSTGRLGGFLIVAGVVIAAVAGPKRDAAAQEEGAAPCDAWDVEYTLAAKLQLSDTPMGAGNGIYAIGPGTTVLRYTNVQGQPGGLVRMRSYTLREKFEIESHAVFWTTHVLTDSRTTTTPDACGDVAKGQLEGRRIRWTTRVSGYRTDGTLNCDGSLCGKFGAPPGGTSELHIPPHAVAFSPFEVAPDLKTFSMPATFVSKTDDPKQTAHVTIWGRVVKRTCVRVTPCP